MEDEHDILEEEELFLNHDTASNFPYTQVPKKNNTIMITAGRCDLNPS